jgi:hypothetical protein
MEYIAKDNDHGVKEQDKQSERDGVEQPPMSSIWLRLKGSSGHPSSI